MVIPDWVVCDCFWNSCINENKETDERTDCRIMCNYYKRMLKCFSRSGLPQSEWKPIKVKSVSEDLETYRFLSTVSKNTTKLCDSGTALYLFGECGTGKSMWSKKIMMRFFESIARTGYGNIDYSDEAMAIIVSYSKLAVDLMMGTENGKTCLDLVDRLSNVPMLVIDDFGDYQLPPSAEVSLTRVIESRFNSGKFTICTSGVKIDKLNIGNRLWDRIRRFTPVEFKASSFRDLEQKSIQDILEGLKDE